MKWFGKMKKWAAFVICLLFFTGCGVEQQNKDFGSEPVSSELESSAAASVPEVSDEENTSDTAGISSKAEQTESYAVGSNIEENGSASGKPAASSTAPQSSKPAASSAAPQSSKPAAASAPSEGNDLLQVARQVIVLVNQERGKQGLPALRENAQLMDSASVRSQELVTKFAHERPNGEQGYQLAFRAGFNTVGENIAYGYLSAEQVMEGWMNSPGHRANILNTGFSEIGVGCYRGSDGRLYWTQLFGG